ncbi:hypothetical protein PLICRDRAFT_31715 [Plicaturopsis crispa FD-325 SS-3]|nr:hypothetical protein PLICRDRAFT_31715 [Plicaturopsis crispa FD-325 SS-3]
MLTLTPGAVCDVCAEEYGPHCVPHSIPCGHVLCRNCCNSIVEKTPSRLHPVCPFCREQFASDNVRLIRIDFTASRWNTPRMRSGTLEANVDSPNDAPLTKSFPFVEPGFNRSRAEARRLEDKVAKVAAKKCSVEEVSTLHKELEDWLTSEDDHTSSLSLSAALLHAILMNHLAHSEASKQAKNIQTSMKARIDEMEMANGKLEAEIRKQRTQNMQLFQEVQTLRAELNRSPTPKTAASSQSTPTATSSSRSSVISPTHESASQRYFSPPLGRSPSVSPTPPPVHSPTAQSPLSRFNSTHSHTRSASLSAPSVRTTTPSLRSHTPSMRAATPSMRSATPSIRAHSHTPSLPHTYRSQTPAVPPVPASARGPVPVKSRTLSSPSPPKMERATSGESTTSTLRQEREREHVLHERWLPRREPDRTPSRFGFSQAPSRAPSAAGLPQRYATPANSP